MKPQTAVILIFLSAGAFFFLGYSGGKGNQKAVYGDSGLPKNCRALISENLYNYANEESTADEALYSIARNCGPNGYIWNER